MTRFERQTYDRHVRRTAKLLGLPAGGNVEEAIIRHCEDQVASWMARFGPPDTLRDLAVMGAAALDLEVQEIHTDADLRQLMERIPPDLEPVMAQVPLELNDDTDAVVIQRQRHRTWERPFLAIINCRGWHSFRRYFSCWHELVHLLLEGRQLRFAFRRTAVVRKDPEEILVDRVAARLAFYPGMFKPVLHDELARGGPLTFQVVDRVRARVAPEASRHATLLACLMHYAKPACLITAAPGYKRAEQRALRSGQGVLFPGARQAPRPRLRVKNCSTSPSVQELSIRFHENMEVPATSVVTRAFEDPLRRLYTGREDLGAWRTSSTGPIGTGEIEVEAQRVGESEVWALIHLRDAA